MALATGVMLNNRYRIVRLVGQGGFGVVYRGWDTSLDRPVAVKEHFDTGPESQRQFEREAKLLAGLRHPRLPVVIDHFVLPGQGQYLVMDFVEGKSLAALLAERGQPLGEQEVLPWIRQVCDALEYLHTSTPPIIHRDIKPDNIIVTADGRAMLVDFGISKVYETNRGTTVGARGITPGFSPPEQYGRGNTDARSDVYALGATLYTLLTAQIPPDGPELSSGSALLPSPASVNPDISQNVSDAIEAAMMPSVSQRLASAGQFVAALTTGVSASARVIPPAATGQAGTRRRIPVLLMVAGLTVLLFLSIAFRPNWFTRWWPPTRSVAPTVPDSPDGPPRSLAGTPTPTQKPATTEPTAVLPIQTLSLTPVNASIPTASPTLQSSPSISPSPSPVSPIPPQPSATMSPSPVPVRLVAPPHGTYWEQIVFSWQGPSELTYRVQLRNSEKQFAHTGPWIDDLTWAFKIPGVQFGNWTWWVESSDGRRTEESTFVYDPNANVGGPIGIYDLNHDCRIDGTDLDIIAGYNYGCYVGDTCYSYGAGFNNDGYVGDYDVDLVSQHVGRDVPDCTPP